MTENFPKPERTPEQIAEAKLRMAKVREARGKMPRLKKSAAQIEKKVRDSVIERVINPPVLLPTPPALDFTGMTVVKCSNECYRTGTCVITGVNNCGHPKMTGLQAPFKLNPDIVSRFNEAEKFLAQQRVDSMPVR